MSNVVVAITVENISCNSFRIIPLLDKAANEHRHQKSQEELGEIYMVKKNCHLRPVFFMCAQQSCNSCNICCYVIIVVLLKPCLVQY